MDSQRKKRIVLNEVATNRVITILCNKDKTCLIKELEIKLCDSGTQSKSAFAS